MGSLIGILSTVILVSTVCTLIFAVGAYVVARRDREGVNDMTGGGELPGVDNMEDQFPHQGGIGESETQGSALFTRMQPGSEPKTDTPNVDDEYQWK